MSKDRRDKCWSCDAPFDGYIFFCPECWVVQPPQAGSAFGKFGISEAFDIEFSQLDKAYFAHQSKLHPDKFIGKSDLERLYSLQQAADLNAAYETLKDPVARAAHLLNLLGEESALTDQTIHDADLLMQIMEKQENLEKAKSRSDVALLHDQAYQEICQIEKDLEHSFKTKNLSQAKQDTHRLKYLSKFLTQCDGKIRNLGSF